jgi:hypothetical protein
MDVSKIDLYINAGMKDKNWYQECEQLFVEIYGRERLPLITKLFAATSINSSLKSNITLFRKALHEIENNLPFSDYLPGIKKQLEYVRAGEPLRGLKINAFSQAMSGDENAVVVDTWLLRAFDMDKQYGRKEWKKEHGVEVLQTRFRSSGASKKAFRDIEAWVRNRAQEMGIQPRELSAIIWTGVRSTLSRERETHYKTILKMKLYNMYETSIQT